MANEAKIFTAIENADDHTVRTLVRRVNMKATQKHGEETETLFAAAMRVYLKTMASEGNKITPRVRKAISILNCLRNEQYSVDVSLSDAIRSVDPEGVEHSLARGAGTKVVFARGPRTSLEIAQAMPGKCTDTPTQQRAQAILDLVKAVAREDEQGASTKRSELAARHLSDITSTVAAGGPSGHTAGGSLRAARHASRGMSGSFGAPSGIREPVVVPPRGARRRSGFVR